MELGILITAVVAALCLGAAVFHSGLSPFWRSVIGFIGLVSLIMMGILIWEYIQTIAVRAYQEMEAVKLAQIKALQGVSDRGIDFLDTHDIRVEMRPTPKGIEQVWVAPGLDFAREDIVYWVKETLKAYPNLPTQHGLTGWEGEEKGYRDELKAFTQMVCGAGLASYPSGNQGAKWLVKARDIPGLLGVEKEM